MADLVTTVTPQAIVETFTSPPDVVKDRTGIARAAITFCSPFASAGTGAGDREQLNVELNLPKNYFYRPIVLSLSLANVNASIGGAWDNIGRLLVESNLNDYLGSLNYATVRTGVTTNSYTLVWGAGALSEKVAGQLIDGRNVAPQSRDPKVSLGLSNVTASVAAQSTFAVYARFLQYDVSQGFHEELWSSGNLISS